MGPKCHACQRDSKPPPHPTYALLPPWQIRSAASLDFSSTRRSPTQNTERKSFSASLIFALLRSGSSRMSLRIWNGKSGGKQKAAMFLSSFPAESIPPLPSHSSTKYLELNASMVSSSITGSCAKVKFMKLPIPSPDPGSTIPHTEVAWAIFLERRKNEGDREERGNTSGNPFIG